MDKKEIIETFICEYFFSEKEFSTKEVMSRFYKERRYRLDDKDVTDTLIEMRKKGLLSYNFSNLTMVWK